MQSEAWGTSRQKEPRDHGIAVADAKRLNDCWHELAEAFAARPALAGDEVHWFQRAHATAGNEEWVHQVNSRNVAEVMLRIAIRDRIFPIWLRLANEEVQVDPNATTDVSHKTLTTGFYVAESHPKSNLEGRPLWIKNSDWECFYAGLMASRYSEQVPPAGSELPARADAADVATKRRAGRTPGSGSYASADAPLLSEMSQHIANGKAMSPHAAAQLVADRASGGGSFDSKVSRLARAFRLLERNRAE